MHNRHILTYRYNYSFHEESNRPWIILISAWSCYVFFQTWREFIHFGSKKYSYSMNMNSSLFNNVDWFFISNAHNHQGMKNTWVKLLQMKSHIEGRQYIKNPPQFCQNTIESREPFFEPLTNSSQTKGFRVNLYIKYHFFTAA